MNGAIGVDAVATGNEVEDTSARQGVRVRHGRRPVLGRRVFCRASTAKATAALASLATVAAGLVTVLSAPSAQAAPGPIAQRTAGQVTADALPTTQIDGVAWTQAINGNTVYVGGSFANARPAGAAAGTNLTPRNNLLAYDITTGVLNSSFAPNLNGQVKALAVSPDGTRLYVAGNFTTADGQTRSRLAAYSTATGALIPNFAPGIDAGVNALAVTDTTVYAAGGFSQVKGVARTRLAAFRAVDGATLSWAPTADAIVNAIVLTPDGSKVIIGGQFANVNGAAALGLAALDSSTGAMLPFAANQVVKDYGTNGAITSLRTDGTAIYGTGYAYGAPSNYEGVFSADPSTGAINWLADCHGDAYDSYAMNGAAYLVSHEHYCVNIGGFPDTSPRSAWYRTTAFTTQATGTVLANGQAGGGYGNFAGQPSPSLLNWFPTLVAGTFTGQDQAAWTVTGNGQYVVEAGEFPSVNGVAQQGLVRFAVPALAPNKRGPQDTSAAVSPRINIRSSTSVRVSWMTNTDQDDQALTYKVFRDDDLVNPRYTTSAVSQFWNRPTIGFVDTGLTPGKAYLYWVKAYDPDGNVARSANVGVTTPPSVTPTPYEQAVRADSPTSYWRLGDPAGNTLSADSIGLNDLTQLTGVSEGASGAVAGDPDTATTFDGTTAGTEGSVNSAAAPDSYSIEAWVNTTSVKGGKIVGFGSSQTGSSATNDRNVYMDNAGHILFGVLANGTVRTTIASPAPYNNGSWHHIVASLSGGGMVLYVDGQRVARNQTVTSGLSMSGYWRVGGDNLTSWTSKPTSAYLAGNIDEVAIYGAPLAADRIRSHYQASGRTLVSTAPPADGYGKSVYVDQPDLFWRLDETAGSTAADASPNNSSGVYSAGVTYATASPVSGATGTAVTFSGTSTGSLASTQTWVNPTVYSEEAWFKTTTTKGGKIVGFQSAQTGTTGSSDRMIYMINTGQLEFGAYANSVKVVLRSATAYNDGKWHQVVASQGPAGMRLYLDGVQVGTNTTAGSSSYTGYWRVGGGATWSGTSGYLAGAIDEVAVYPSVLGADRVLAHYRASYASPNAAPTAAFASSCTNLSCSFDASTSADPDGTVVSYAWDFGDGTTATGATASHGYAAGGTYAVKLVVTDNKGLASAAAAQSVTVAPPPNQLPTAALTVSCTNLACSVDGSGSVDPDGTVVSYAWDFGDGTTATGSATTAAHTYASDGTYPVTLTVTDNRSGVSAPAQYTVTVAANRAPAASFTSACNDLACGFDATASTDADGTIAGYAWDFGDGTTGTGAAPNHTFAATGTYSVTLVVTDNQGLASGPDVAALTVVITPNNAPVASFSPSCHGLVCSFDGTVSADSDGSIAAYAWTFGDGTSDAGANPTHGFPASGNYTVTLTVTDNRGATGTTSATVTVNGVVTFAADSFTRTTASGWGTADTGGTWKTTGAANLFATNGSSATMALTTVGSGPSAGLPSISRADLIQTVDVAGDKLATGNGYAVALRSRTVGTTYYQLKLRFMTGGVVHLVLSKVVNGTETVFREMNVPSATYAPNDVLRLQFTTTSGGGPTTTLSGAVWKVGSAAPTAPQISQTDSDTALTGAGSVAVQSFLQSGSTDVPVTVKFDNYSATSLN